MFQIKKKCFITTMLITLGLMAASGCNDNTATVSTKNINEMLMTNIVSDITTYDTITVGKSDIDYFHFGRGVMVFPNTQKLTQTYSYGTVTFVKYNVSFLGGGKFVEEGESIATLRLNIDPVSREEARIKLEKAEASYRNTLTKKGENLETKKAKISTAKTFYEQQLLEMEYNDALTEYNEYVETQEEYIAELEEEYNLYTHETMEFDIYAPTKGIVVQTESYNSGDIIDYEAVIATLYSFDKIYISVTGNNYNYGDAVSVSINTGRESIDFTGTVISGANLLYNTTVKTNIIELDPSSLQTVDFSGISFRNLREGISVSSSTSIANDSFIIPVSALKGEITGDTGTVSLYKDGIVYLTNVKIGYKNNEYAWIVAGLNEGDEILK